MMGKSTTAAALVLAGLAVTSAAAPAHAAEELSSQGRNASVSRTQKTGYIDYRSVEEIYFTKNRPDPEGKYGYWKLNFKLTPLGRGAVVVNPNYVLGPAWHELVAAYPRSTNYYTMYQQWECHVAGASASGSLATVKFDLESYRRNYPDWKKGAVMRGVKAAIKSKNIRALGVACNW